jgi:hypothetical protein
MDGWSLDCNDSASTVPLSFLYWCCLRRLTRLISLSMSEVKCDFGWWFLHVFLVSCSDVGCWDLNCLSRSRAYRSWCRSCF